MSRKLYTQWLKLLSRDVMLQNIGWKTAWWIFVDIDIHEWISHLWKHINLWFHWSKFLSTIFFYFKEKSTKNIDKTIQISQIFPVSLETKIRIIWKVIQNIIVKELSSPPIQIKSWRYEYNMALKQGHFESPLQ